MLKTDFEICWLTAENIENMNVDVLKLFSQNTLFRYKNIKILIGILELLYILFYIVKLNLFYIDSINDSDIAAEYLLAQILSNETGIFSDNWYYSFDLRILYLQIVSSILFHFTSNYYVVMGFTNLIWIIFYAVSYCFMMKVIGIKWENIILTLPLILTAFSKQTIYYMYGGGFYLPYLTWIFITFSIVLLVKRQGRFLLLLPILAIVSMALGMAGFRYMAILFLPLLLAGIIAFFFECKRLTFHTIKDSIYLPYIFSALFSCLFACIGFAINYTYLIHRFSVSNLDDRGFVQVSELANQFFSLCVSFIQAFGYSSGVELFSLRGIANCFGFLLFCLLIFVITRIMEIRKESALSVEKKIYLYFVFAAFICISFISIFTGDMSTVLYKYVIHAFVLIIATTALYFALETKSVSSGLVMLLILIAVVFLNTVSYRTAINSDNCWSRNGYITYLTENGYKYGYATFWNCDITTFMCNNGTQVVPIEDEATLTKRCWLADKRIYDSSYNTTDTYFILLTLEEEKNFVLNGNEKGGEVGYKDDFYVIYTYDGRGF